MDIRVDNEPTSPLATEPADVLSALAEVSDGLRNRGRAVMSIRIDGQAVPADMLSKTLKDKPVSEVSLLEINTENMSDLVNSSLNDLEQVLPDLPQVCRSLAEVFQSDNPDAGYSPFNQLAEIWKTVKERQMQIASALNIDLSSLEVQGKSVASHHAELNQLLSEAAEALQSGDCVTLGDLLEHEMPQQAEFESRIIDVLRSRTQGAPA